MAPGYEDMATLKAIKAAPDYWAKVNPPTASCSGIIRLQRADLG